MVMRSVRLLVLLSVLTLSLTLVSSACSDSGFSPREGYWLGSHLTFQVKDGEVLELGGLTISCNGEDGCFGDGNRFYADALAITSINFAGILTHKLGTLEITGEFTSSVEAEGTYRFESVDGCCSVSGRWGAEFKQPYESEQPDLPDILDEDSATPGDGHAPDVPFEPSVYPPSASEEQILAVQYVNEIRGLLDIPAIIETEEINNAAQAHAGYYQIHCSGYKKEKLSPHMENPQWVEGFTGVNFLDRMTHFGFTGLPGWEVMAFLGHPVSAVDSWIETLYHRIPFVHPNTYEMGYGMILGGCEWWATGTDVMNFSRLKEVEVDHAVAYPYDGQTEVYPSWNGMESPQPPIPPGGYPSGPIVTLTFPNSGKFHMDDHRLLGPGDTQVEHMWVTPENDPGGFLSRTVAMYSIAPLQAKTEYRAIIGGKWNNQDMVWDWKFVTGELPESPW